jgi:hypothetical protein
LQPNEEIFSFTEDRIADLEVILTRIKKALRENEVGIAQESVVRAGKIWWLIASLIEELKERESE